MLSLLSLDQGAKPCCVDATILLLCIIVVTLADTQGYARVDFWNCEATSWTTPVAVLLILTLGLCCVKRRAVLIGRNYREELSDEIGKSCTLHDQRKAALSNCQSAAKLLQAQADNNAELLKRHEVTIADVRGKMELPVSDLDDLRRCDAAFDKCLDDTRAHNEDDLKRLPELRHEREHIETSLRMSHESRSSTLRDIAMLEDEFRVLHDLMQKSDFLHLSEFPDASLGDDAVAMDASEFETTVRQHDEDIVRLRRELEACSAEVQLLDASEKRPRPVTEGLARVACGSSQPQETHHGEKTAHGLDVTMSKGRVLNGAEEDNKSKLLASKGFAQSPESHHPEPEWRREVAEHLQQTHDRLTEALHKQERDIEAATKQLAEVQTKYGHVIALVAEEAAEAAALQAQVEQTRERMKSFENMQLELEKSEAMLETCRSNIAKEREDKIRMRAHFDEEKLRGQLLMAIFAQFKDKLQKSSFEELVTRFQSLTEANLDGVSVGVSSAKST